MDTMEGVLVGISRVPESELEDAVEGLGGCVRRQSFGGYVRIHTNKVGNT